MSSLEQITTSMKWRFPARQAGATPPRSEATPAPAPATPESSTAPARPPPAAPDDRSRPKRRSNSGFSIRNLECAPHPNRIPNAKFLIPNGRFSSPVAEVAELADAPA
jgi:hypothetical protein